jgi:hypothetical protein
MSPVLPYNIVTGDGGGKRKMKKRIFAILVVGLFLAVAAASATNTAPAPKANDKVMSVVIGQDNQKLTKEIVTADQTQLNNFVTELMDFKTWIANERPFQDLKLTDDEKNEIKTRISGLVDSLNNILVASDLDPVTTDWLFTEMFETEPGRSTIISVGMGYAFIPFYDYETFLGVMLRPMWLLYPPIFLLGGGYTGNLNVNILPPRIEYGDRLGCHIVRTTIFTGLYINIGELGYDRMFGPGAMILLGRARVVM